jgi:LPS-assembly lipoprotein
MLWHERTSVSRLRGLATLLPLLLLTGCLHPLYAGGENGLVAEDLRAIQVTPIGQRIGHYIEDDLIFQLNGTGAHVTPRYKLDVTPYEGNNTPLVDTVTGIATASTVTTTAVYVLTSLETGKVVAHGKVFVSATYDRTSQRFSDMRAARDAEQRDARNIADQIRTQVAAALTPRT